MTENTASIEAIHKCDLLVVGSGAAGMATALRAAHDGFNVIVAEKSPHFGGTTALSAGWSWVPGNRKGAAATGDTRAEVEEYLRALAPETYNEKGIEGFLDTVPEAIDFFEEHTSVTFSYPEKAPDYKMDLPGAKLGGRAVLPADADIRMLGARRKELQPYLSSYTVFGYMPQVGPDMATILKANQSPRAFAYTARKLLRTWADTAMYQQPMKRTNGSALMTRMVASALDAGVRVWTMTPVVELTVDADGAVTGALLAGERAGRVQARLGVVLAGGGFTGDEDLRRRYFPHDRHGGEHFTPTQGHDGSSARMAIKAGGRINNEVSSVASWAPVTVFRNLRTGARRLFPHLRQIGLPGMITVDRHGKRFGNEALSYHDFGGQMLAHMKDEDSVYAWIVGDEKLMRKYGIGYAKPWPIPRGLFYKMGYLHKGNSIEDLAEKIGVDPEGLKATIERFNRDAVAGEDTEFGRGSTAYNHFRGDMDHKPNPNLAPLDKAPYYAAKVRMGDLGTFAGIDVDERHAVVRPDRSRIPGLYSVGAAAVSVFGGGYPGYGSHIGPALVFGYRLGRDIASLAAESGRAEALKRAMEVGA
ncbi:FAD-dependent oxidoreductase [Arthrobacter caoxuetaonis]|uniref:FAD-dependent oxidoreductase n=1 Tax=Arthrobacter caoxuetaonis TaxID=2886935 RepID=UPI001D1534B8|nr:FAD-dependent oxidoreductase [Arthrobacter caoxuetaonis]MCC3281975.1 FAD-dependent oxidoreductase [Arthrobacter caoxuetaonis]MCC3282986.1 FAD-dependent oxidoreductase [Arthrobacter caoxuetaonis]